MQQKWPLTIRLDELNGFLRQTIGAVFTGRTVGIRLHLEAIRRKVTGRSSVRMRVHGDLETLFVRPIWLGQAEVPFSNMSRAPTRIAQGLCESVFGRFQIV